MIELGDLREGIWNKDELISTALEIESMQHVHLKGVATNLGCYGAIRPTRDKLQELVNAAELIESKIGRRLETISGGGYTSLPLVWAGEMPERINHLRVGEGILIGYDVEKSTMLPAAGFESGTIVLQAEVVESRVKPTHPIGEILLDAFRVKPTYDDFGEQARVIVAVGRGDYGATDGITPRNQNLKIIGASSDHTLLMDKIGDEMKNSLPNSILDRKTGVFVSEIELGRESRVVGGRTATSDCCDCDIGRTSTSDRRDCSDGNNCDIGSDGRNDSDYNNCGDGRICDICGASDIDLGDIVEFDVHYGAALMLMHSDIEIVYMHKNVI